MNYIISKFINDISLNPREFLLDDQGEIKEFSSKRDALAYLLLLGVEESEIGYSIFIGTSSQPDILTYDTDEYQELREDISINSKV